MADDKDATLPAGESPSGLALDGTLPSGDDGAAPVVRAGRPGDYDDLIAVDPRHYLLGDEIARGGMGKIIKGRDRRFGREVAIKVLLGSSEQARARFEREARITGRLQHPAIISVHEAGVWPSGEPFFAMKLVAGRALDKVVADRATLAERLGLLPNVVAAIDALAYAHAQRVIHRDLKPSNVLVGDFGETVVIDWGLAKDLAAPASPESAEDHRRDRDADAIAGETVAGSIMGTPAYMPPEQALGDAVDERADVYALGALLYHVLAGAPPYDGKSVDEILAKVVAEPPPPLASRVDGVPPDLVTIVAKAMAHAPVDRYPTARELSDDLKKFQTGQLVASHRYSLGELLRRWLRRHRAAVGVGSIALLVVATVGVLAIRRVVAAEHRAQDERERALHSRSDAEDLMSFMLGELSDKLKPLGRLDLLDGVASKAIAYYGRREDDLSDEERAHRAAAHRSIGDVLADRGKTDDALAEYRAAAAIDDAITARAPSRGEWAREATISHLRISDALVRLGHTDAAIDEIKRVLAIRERAAAAAPGDLQTQRDLLAVYARLSDVLLRSKGDTAGALAEGRAELALAETITRKQPGTLDSRLDLVRAHGRIASALLSAGDTAAAADEAREELRQVEAGLALEPGNADLLFDQAVAQRSLGKALAEQGDSGGALEAFRKDLAIREQLVAKDPSNVDWQMERAIVHQDVGDALEARGDWSGAEAEFRQYRDLLLPLVALDPHDTRKRRSLAAAYDRIGTMALTRGDYAAAIPELRQEESIAAELLEHDPDNGADLFALASSHQKLGDTLMRQGDLPTALAEFRALLSLAERLASKDPKFGRRPIAIAHDRIGETLRLMGKLDDALVEQRQSLAIREEMAAANPSNMHRQQDLASGHRAIGTVLLDGHHVAEGRAELEQAREILERMLATDPNNNEWRSSLAEVKAQLSSAN